MDEEFVEKIHELTNCLLLPENLVIKKPERAEALLEYVKSCWNEIERGDFPKGETLLEYAAKATVLTARKDGEKLYKEKLKQVLGWGSERRYIDWDQLEIISNEAREKALNHLRKTSLVDVKDERELVEDLDKIYELFKEENQSLKEIMMGKLRRSKEQTIDEYGRRMQKEISEGYKSQNELKMLHDSLSKELISRCDEFRGCCVHEKWVKGMAEDFEKIYEIVGQLNETNEPITPKLDSMTAIGAVAGAGGMVGMAAAKGPVVGAISLTVAGAGAGVAMAKKKWDKMTKRPQITKDLTEAMEKLKKDAWSDNL